MILSITPESFFVPLQFLHLVHQTTTDLLLLIINLTILQFDKNESTLCFVWPQIIMLIFFQFACVVIVHSFCCVIPCHYIAEPCTTVVAVSLASLPMRNLESCLHLFFLQYIACLLGGKRGFKIWF